MSELPEKLIGEISAITLILAELKSELYFYKAPKDLINKTDKLQKEARSLMREISFQGKE